jgi:hypothetical protein
VRCGSNAGCVEAARLSEQIGVRDSKNVATSPVLTFTPQVWKGFLGGIKGGEFDLS